MQRIECMIGGTILVILIMGYVSHNWVWKVIIRDTM